jgi:hypothetical protein
MLERRKYVNVGSKNGINKAYFIAFLLLLHSLKSVEGILNKRRESLLMS